MKTRYRMNHRNGTPVLIYLGCLGIVALWLIIMTVFAFALQWLALAFLDKSVPLWICWIISFLIIGLINSVRSR